MRAGSWKVAVGGMGMGLEKKIWRNDKRDGGKETYPVRVGESDVGTATPSEEY
jgi:hypothetical protein